ncbi:MAG: hypothetical protein KDF60_18580 [Calditrichaeota bacterium]|nr:hypothetical protein [Calditrichota bacterium]
MDCIFIIVKMISLDLLGIRRVNLDADIFEIDPEFLSTITAEITDGYCNNPDIKIFKDNCK